MLLAAALTLLTLAVVATVILPLMKSAGGAPDRAEFDRAVYRDQLRELERDIGRGLVEPGEAATARLEIERRLLAAEERPEGPPPRGGSPALAIALALAVPAAAALLYLALGSPGIPDDPYALRGIRMLAALEAEVKAQPDSAAAWSHLARAEAEAGRWQKSAEAYREAMRLTKGRPDIATSYGEMLVMAADGTVTTRAQEAFTAALARDPGNAAARFYLALADAQEGKPQAAIDAWQRLAGDQPADSPLRAEIQQRIADAAKAAGLPVPPLAAPAAAEGPSPEDMARAAQMSPQERETMIRGMVAKLAARLKANPDDADGWTRLARAYAVLGERDQAADAYEQAARLKPDDPQFPLAEVEMLMRGRAPQAPIPERVVALLQRVEALDPDEPAALWYLGLAAAQQRRFAEASGYWQRLLPLLPEDSDQRKTVSAAIDALKGK